MIKSLSATLLPDEILEELRELIEQAEEANRDAEKEKEVLKNKIEIRRRVIKLNAEIAEKGRKGAESREQLEEFDRQNAKTLSNYKELLPYKEKINQFISKQEELVKLNKDLEESKQRDERLETRVGQLISEVSLWVKKKSLLIISSTNWKRSKKR